MKTIKWNTLPEYSDLNKNRLKPPVDKIVGEVVFDVEENLDINEIISYEEIINLSDKEREFNFKTFKNLEIEDILLVEDIIGRNLLKTDFENIDLFLRDSNSIIVNLLFNLSITKNDRGIKKKIIFKKLLNFLKKNFNLLILNENIHQFFCIKSPDYIIESIYFLETVTGNKIENIEISEDLIKSLNLNYNKFSEKNKINKMGKYFEGQISLNDLEKDINYLMIILRRVYGNGDITNKLNYLNNIFGIKPCYQDLKKTLKNKFDFIDFLMGIDGSIKHFLEYYKKDINSYDDLLKIEGIGKYFIYHNSKEFSLTSFEILKKYKLLPGIDELSTSLNSTSISTFLEVQINLDEENIDFCFNKKLFNNLDDFLILYEKGTFNNKNFDLFIENYEYLEKKLGRKIIKEDLESEYVIFFLQFGDKKNLDFLVKNFKINNSYSFLSCLLTESKVGYKDIEFRHLLSFISQHGLSEKIEFLYKTIGEKFNIFEYFENVHNYYDYENIKDNVFGLKDKNIKNFKEKGKDIDNFSDNLDYLFKKYPNIELSTHLFILLENIGDNIILFDIFDIEFENLKDIKFITFLLKVNVGIINIILENIPDININNLFNIYKINGDLLENKIGWQYNKLKDSSGEYYSNIYMNILRYSYTRKNNFLEGNLSVFYNIIDCTENINDIKGKITIKNIVEILDKTGGIITHNLFKECILKDNDLNEYLNYYKECKNILLDGGTLNGKNDKYGFFNEVITEVYPNRDYNKGYFVGFEDKSEHLNKYNYEKNGYMIILRGKEKHKLVGEINTDLDYLYDEIIELSKNEQKIIDFIKNFFSTNNEILKTKTLEGNILEYFIYLEKKGKKGLYKDLNIIIAYQILDRREEFIKLYNYGEADNLEYNKKYILGNEYGDKLKESQDKLYEKLDNEDKQILEENSNFKKNKKYKNILIKKEKIKELICNIPANRIKIKVINKIFSKQLKAFLNKEQLNYFCEKNIEYNLNENIDKFDNIYIKILNEIFNINKLDFNIITNLGIKTFNVFKDELNKFTIIGNQTNNIIPNKEKIIKAYFLKNKESYKALGVGGSCIGSDENRWLNPNYFELILMDINIEKNVGAIELLEMNDKKGKYLFFGPNPSENILQKVNQEILYNEIKNIIINFAKQNGFIGVVTSIKNGEATNSTGKFNDIFIKSVEGKGKISLDKKYTLGLNYVFQNNLDIIWKK